MVVRGGKERSQPVTPGRAQAEVHYILGDISCGTPITPVSLTFGEDTLTKTMMGANEVLASCAGWLMVSASNTTSCRDLASSNMRSISLCTSAKEGEQLTRGSAHCLIQGFEGCCVVSRKDLTDSLGWQGTGQRRADLGRGGGAWAKTKQNKTVLRASNRQRSRTKECSPMLERAEERSMMVLLPGLLSTDRFASERSAVTLVIEILVWRVTAAFKPKSFF